MNDGDTMLVTEKLVAETCCNCRMTFAMNAEFRQARLDNPGTWFYCPAGHGQLLHREVGGPKAPGRVGAGTAADSQRSRRGREAECGEGSGSPSGRRRSRSGDADQAPRAERRVPLLQPHLRRPPPPHGKPAPGLRGEVRWLTPLPL